MRRARRASQRGFIIYATVLVLLLGIVTVAITYYRPARQAQGATLRESDVFSDVKSALIGYAARQGVFRCTNPDDVVACQAQLDNSSRLGELPCPDSNNDGIADAPCTSRLGRVPWITLGIPEPKDSSGETLWYAVSALWINNAPNPNTAINSATPGDLSVLAADGSLVTANAVAVILSPGSVVQNQTRPQCELRTQPAPAACVAAANFLEAQGAGDNRSITAAGFVAGNRTATFNDRVVYLSPSELVPVLEMRLGGELRELLLAYKFNSQCFCYPWADSWAYSGGIADYGVNRGRLPNPAADIAPTAGTLEPQNWGMSGIPAFPAWVDDNDWHNHVYYIASRQETNPTLGGCLTCTANPYLTIQGNNPATAAAAIITPGTPRNGARPYLPSVAGTAAGKLLMNNFSLFFDDAMNRKSGCAGETTEHSHNPGSYTVVGVGASCDTLTRPSSGAYDRNRIFVLPPEGSLDPATICPHAGPALYQATPCHDPFGVNQLSGMCNRLAPLLQQCSPACRDAAVQMTVVPCRNNRSASECPPYHAALLSCSA